MFSPTSSCMGMALLYFLILMIVVSNAQGPPSPGYFPNSKFSSLDFYQGYRNEWSPQHQSVEQGQLRIWLDRSSGSGFKSLKPYRSSYISADIKLHPGYTAGVITCLFLSNNEDYPGRHDEIDIEFLGTIPGKPYTLQTNVYMNGSGDGALIGREMRFHLWFDPTQDFHNYALLWTPNEVIFLVDDVPIRRYPKKSDHTYPLKPMWVYGSIWDASSWATEGGKYKVDYQYQPFIARYNNFKIGGCTPDRPASCRSPSVSPSTSVGLSQQQYAAMAWVHNNYMVYDYCKDPYKDHSQISEC